MDNSNRYNSGTTQKQVQSSTNYHLSHSAQQQSRMKSSDFQQQSSSKQNHQYITSDQATNATKQMQQQYIISSQQQYSHQHQQRESDVVGKQSGVNTKHKPQFSQMSVESPKFTVNQQQQQAQHQKQRSSGAQQSRRQHSSGTNNNRHSNQQHHQSVQQSAKYPSHAQQNSKGDQKQITGMKQQDNQQKKGNVQSYSQSRYVSQKNEKDIKQITKIDLRNLNQLDNTIEEEDLEQQLRAAQAMSTAQSRSQSYAAPKRKKEELKVEESESDDSEQERQIAANNGRNVPSSTYHQITGEELRYELFFAPRNNSKGGGQNEYFSYKEMVQMYQAEIKRRWDQRAQIKDRYVFPRMATIRQSSKVSQPDQKLPDRRHLSKTPIVMAQINPKVTQESQTPLMDSKGPSQVISLIPSEGKISPTKTRSKQSAQQNQAQKLYSSKDVVQSSQKLTQQQLNQIQQQKNAQGKMGSNKQVQSHFKNAMSSEPVTKSQRGMQGSDHQHTQSATVVQIVKSSHDLSKMTNAQQQSNDKKHSGSNNNILLSQASVVPDSKRERRNQQQIQNMMKYNQNSSQQQQSQASKTPILLNHQNAKAGGIKQQFHQEPAIHLSRNGNLNDLQKPQIMSMQPQHRMKVEGQLLSYGGPIHSQMQLGVASQQQIQTVNSASLKSQQMGGRSMTQVQPQQQVRPGNQSYAIIPNHQQKQSIDSFKKTSNQQTRHESQKVVKKSSNQHYTQYNKSFNNKYEIKKQSSGTRNTASIISVKSSKSPAMSKPSQKAIIGTNNDGQAKNTTQERTMTQQQMQMMAIGDQISQRQTTRSQIKSDQIPQTFTKFKSKASVNKNSSIISLNKFNEIQLNERDSQNNGQQMVHMSSNRAAQRKNLQYQNYKASIEQHLGSQGSMMSGHESNRKSGTQSTDKHNQRGAKSSNNIQKFVSDSNQHQMVRMVKNNTQLQKSLDTGTSLVATLDKPDDPSRTNNSVSPVKPKSSKIYNQQVLQPTLITTENMSQHHLNMQNSVQSIRQTLTMHKKNVTDQKSPHTKQNFQQAPVSIFDTSPDSQNYDNSKKKQQEILKSHHNFIVPYDEAVVRGLPSQEQYRTQSMLDIQQQKHGHSQSTDIQRYLSQQSQSSQNMAKNFIINNAPMTSQLDLSNSRGNYQNDMSIIKEAQRETNENLFDTHDNVFDNAGQRASKTQTVIRQPSNSENVAPDLSHESITFLHNEQIDSNQNPVAPDTGKKTVYKIFKDGNHNMKGPHIQQKSFNFKKEPKMIQKSIVTHNQTRSMQSIERPLSSKSQHRSDRQKKHNFQQQQKQHNHMFNEYNDTIESLTQMKNQRQRSSGLNNASSLSNFQTDSSAKLQNQGSSNKHQKNFSKSSSKQNMPTSQQQLLAQQQQQIINNISNGLTTSAPQATRLIQKQIQGQSFSLNNMIVSRNVNQGLKNINSMKEQRIVNVSSDQIHGISQQQMNTLQANQSQQNLVQANDMILSMQKQPQITSKLSFKHQAQRSQNQQSVLFKPTNIIQGSHSNTKGQVQSRNPQLMPAQSSSIIYGASGGQSNSFVGSLNQMGASGDSMVGQNHQHFHSISSQHELSHLQNSNTGSNFRRQMIRDGSQPTMNNNQKSSQTSLITLNMAVNNFQVNARSGADPSYYGGGPAQTSSNQAGASGVPNSYSLQIQPKIPKKKRQTNSYSGAPQSNNIPGTSSSAQNPMVGKMLNAANAQAYGDSHGLVSSMSTSIQHQIAPSMMQGQGQQFAHHGHYQQIVQTSNKSSGNAKHRAKNNSSSQSVTTGQNMKHNSYQHGGYAGYHAIMNSATMNNVHSQKNIVTTASNQSKIKANSVYSHLHGQQLSQHHQMIGGTAGPVSQMGVLRNTQMKPKK